MVEGEAGAEVTTGCCVWVGGAVGSGAFGPPGAWPRPRDGTVEVVVGATGVDLGGMVVAAWALDSSSLTTSWRARTVAARSVTSSATIDVAVQTIAVDATVTPNQSAVVNSRGSRTPRGCTLPDGQGLRESQMFRPGISDPC